MNITVFSAHPDDAEFAMGGALIKLARTHTVTNVILTRGEAGTHGDPKTREREGKAAGAHAGYNVRFLDHTDTLVEDTPKSVHEIARVIRELEPRVIFTPYHTNNGSHTDGRAHHDHTELGQIVRKATRIAKFKNAQVEGDAHFAERIIYYMVPKYLKPSFLIDVTDVADELPAFWKTHESQTALRDGAIIEHLLAWRSAAGSGARIRYAEEFMVEEPLVLNEPTLRELFIDRT